MQGAESAESKFRECLLAGRTAGDLCDFAGTSSLAQNNFG